MKFSVCVGAVFSGRDFYESMGTIKDLGIDTIEFWSWWDMDIDRICKRKDELGLKVSAFCTRFVSLVDSAKREEYLAGLKESIEIAKRLGCKTLITQVGDELPGISRAEQHKNLVEGLKACVPILKMEEMNLIFEPLNILVDHKGYYLHSADEAFRIVEEVGSPNVKVLYDVYHQQISDGHLISRITSNIDKIGHFHAAGNPGRHEPSMGEINYTAIFEVIDQTGFKGYMGLEYFPVKDPAVGLRELMSWQK